MKRLNLLLLFSAIALVLLTFSCRREAEFESVDYRDIVPSAKKEYKEGLDKDTNEIDIWDNNFVENAIDSSLLQGIPNLKLREEEESYAYFPDRLSYTSKWARVLNIDSMLVHAVRWNFVDSVTTENAFYNWLDCFGDNCISVRVGEEVNFSDKHSIIYVGERQLILLESESFEDLEVFSNIIVGSTKEKWKYIVEQKARKTANWLALPANVKTTQLQSDI